MRVASRPRDSKRRPLSIEAYTVILFDEAHRRAAVETVDAQDADEAFELACAAHVIEMAADGGPRFDPAAFAVGVTCAAVFAGEHRSRFAAGERAAERPSFEPFTSIVLDNEHAVITVWHTYAKTPFEAFFAACELYADAAREQLGDGFDAKRFRGAAQCIGVFAGWLHDLSPELPASMPGTGRAE
jgi:hypothetical protein